VKLTFGLLARRAEIDPESGLFDIAGGGVDVFVLERLPAEFPVAFALQFGYPELEAGRAFQITVATLGPQIQLVGEPTDFEITPQLGEYHADGWQGIYAVAGTVILAVESPGTHSVSIKIDGAVAGDIPFQVFQASGG
jgi:hypothetical protein